MHFLKIRASIGTAAALGLERIKTDALPTTAYLMMYSKESCLSNCAFCPQARESSSKTNSLSRVLWPEYNLDDIILHLKKNSTKLKRICIQTIRFKNSDNELLKLLRGLWESNLSIPLTVCCYPTTSDVFREMKELGVSRVGISFDCATPEIYENIKGLNRECDVSWLILESTIHETQRIFGNRFVSTHLIVGLGETEKEAVEFIQRFYDQKITVGLFAFTPIKGTALENHPQPSLASYRKIQFARHLIFSDISSFSEMKFSDSKDDYGKIVSFGIQRQKLDEELTTGKPFRTSGCPHCNRPFYNESPGKELYNYPWDPNPDEVKRIRTYFSDF